MLTRSYSIFRLQKWFCTCISIRVASIVIARRFKTTCEEYTQEQRAISCVIFKLPSFYGKIKRFNEHSCYQSAQNFIEIRHAKFSSVTSLLRILKKKRKRNRLQSFTFPEHTRSYIEEYAELRKNPIRFTRKVILYIREYVSPYTFLYICINAYFSC